VSTSALGSTDLSSNKRANYGVSHSITHSVAILESDAVTDIVADAVTNHVPDCIAYHKPNGVSDSIAHDFTNSVAHIKSYICTYSFTNVADFVTNRRANVVQRCVHQVLCHFCLCERPVCGYEGPPLFVNSDAFVNIVMPASTLQNYDGPPLFVNSDAFVNTGRLHTHVPLECSWYDSYKHW
jgi:hypothetical protein